MIKFDAFTLKLWAKEVREYFTGARIRKIRQPGSRELVFDMRNKNENRKLYINFHPDFQHICFMSDENEKKRRLIIPKAAPMFCMLLRKYILNSKIEDIKVPSHERILEIYFEYTDELNDKSKLCLAIELMGKHGNIILYNYDTNVIIGCAHNVSSEKSRERELYGTLPYVYPPRQKKKDILKVTKEVFSEAVDDDNLARSCSEKYHYVTVPFAEDILNNTEHGTKSEMYDCLTDFFGKKTFVPKMSKDYSKFTYLDGEGFSVKNTVNEMIDDYFSFHIKNFLIKNLRTKTLHFLNTKLNKLYNLKSKQDEQILKESKAQGYKTKADLIMTYMYQISKGDKSIRVYDFEGNEIEISLDENKTPIENANRYYNLYRKTKTAHEYALRLIKETESQIMYFEEQKYFAENEENVDELEALFNEISGNEVSREESKEPAEHIEHEGYRIYYGKNKKQNDLILSKIAAPEDIWFHPLNFAGSHVILKLNNSKEEVPENVILKAAQITKEFSSQKNNSKTCIIYTKRKYVKKANNKQAFVTYKNETEIVV